jgi:hypothetical protein
MLGHNQLKLLTEALFKSMEAHQFNNLLNTLEFLSKIVEVSSKVNKITLNVLRKNCQKLHA